MHNTLNSEPLNNLLPDECCPKCGNEMDKLNKMRIDNFLSFITFKILAVERYLCFGCFWEHRKLNI